MEVQIAGSDARRLVDELAFTKMEIDPDLLDAMDDGYGPQAGRKLTQESCFDSAGLEHIGNPNHAGCKRSRETTCIINSRCLSVQKLSAKMVCEKDECIAEQKGNVQFWENATLLEVKHD